MNKKTYKRKKVDMIKAYFRTHRTGTATDIQEFLMSCKNFSGRPVKYALMSPAQVGQLMRSMRFKKDEGGEWYPPARFRPGGT